MSFVLIVSDTPGSGKTALAAALADRWTLAGRRTLYCKLLSPSPAGDSDMAYITARLGVEEAGGGLPVSLPETGQVPDSLFQGAEETLRGMGAVSDTVLIEGPNLSDSPEGLGTTVGALADRLKAGVILVVGYRASLTSQQVLKACHGLGDRLVGVLLNGVRRYRHREVRLELGPALASEGVAFLGAIPEDRAMLSVTLAQVAQHLGGRWVLGEKKAQDLVECFLIGGNIMDSGASYFGRMDNKAVIARGDRPDIHLATLSTPTTCLVLTGGHDPIQYVYYQAQQEEVPVLVVETDTMSTAGSLDTVLSLSTVHHPRKIERFQELLLQHADLGPLDRAAGIAN